VVGEMANERLQLTSGQWIVGILFAVACVVGVIIAAKAIQSTNNQVPSELCKLSTYGVATVAYGLTHGHDGEAIYQAVAKGGANAACKQWINALNADTARKAAFTLHTANGDQNFSVANVQLTATRPNPNHNNQRFVDCYASYDSGWLFKLCFDGKIDP
jgi:hypothetical protein